MQHFCLKVYEVPVGLKIIHSLYLQNPKMVEKRAFSGNQSIFSQNCCKIGSKCAQNVPIYISAFLSA